MDAQLTSGIIWTKTSKRGIANQRRHILNMGLVVGSLCLALTAGVLWVAMVF